MTQQPFSSPSSRGAVDLSGLSPEPAAAAPASAAGRASSPAVVEATDESINAIMNGSMTVPTVLLVWSASQGGRDCLDDFADVARAAGGRFLLATVDVDTTPGLAQALGVREVPMAVALLQGQPVPLFVGPTPRAVIEQAVDKLLEVCVANGITGRVPMDVADEQTQELPPLHQEAYDAIDRGDLEAAADAYRRAIAENPKDREAALGLAQIALIQRTEGVDPVAARQAAANDPEDVDAQVVVADLDVIGGHVEDAFARLLDVVRGGGEGREKARLHLIDLFDVIGSEDPRVRAARTALMSALF